MVEGAVCRVQMQGVGLRVQGSGFRRTEWRGTPGKG
jgi:predicted nucleic acid-binding Zn ribbon protein